MSFRQKVNEGQKEKISISDFIIKAVSKVNKEITVVNSQLHSNKLRTFRDVDVSFAVEIDNGLITPIVKQANKKSLRDISRETKELIDKAKNGKLLPNEY